MSTLIQKHYSTTLEAKTYVFWDFIPFGIRLLLGMVKRTRKRRKGLFVN